MPTPPSRWYKSYENRAAASNTALFQCSISRSEIIGKDKSVSLKRPAFLFRQTPYQYTGRLFCTFGNLGSIAEFESAKTVRQKRIRRRNKRLCKIKRIARCQN